MPGAKVSVHRKPVTTSQPLSCYVDKSWRSTSLPAGFAFTLSPRRDTTSLQKSNHNPPPYEDDTGFIRILQTGLLETTALLLKLASFHELMLLTRPK
jgi:hypothetical protein